VIGSLSMEQKKITIHNKISPNYKEIHVDGGYGGLTPKGFINVSFYAERRPIPTSTEHEVTEHGNLGKILSNSPDSKEGILREYEFGIYMDLTTAKNLAQFINGKVVELEKLLNDRNPNK
jgi:hypothetical protein